MQRLICLLLTSLVVLCARSSLAASSGWQHTNHLTAELVSEYQQIAPGQSLQLALHFLPDEHWHTYWQNPGDSGLATSLTWQLPDGVTVGDIIWPTPRAFSLPPLMNYGFEGHTILLSQLQIPTDYAAETLQIELVADWLVCEEICVPASASFKLNLPVGTNAVMAEQYKPLFAEAKKRLPATLNAKGRFDTSGSVFSAIIDLPQKLNVSRFFVAETELVDHAATQQILLNDKQLMLQQELNTYFSAAPDALEVVLVTNNGAYSVLLNKTNGSSTDILITQGEQSVAPLWLILLLAASGGLLLNLMPCVFPVLSLKALSLANTGQHRSAQQRDALLYSAGVVLSFAVLALMLIVLRAAGQAVGWGFQLQNSYLVALLVYLLFALGLSLSGVVQFGLGLMNSGSSLASDKGGKGAFFTGVLAVVVASPCTAPFMGTALGYAVGQSAVVALTVFVALGLGMALPFLLLAFVPGFARLLPKPGAWMESFKQWLAYPLYLSAVWLLWVYGRQTGINAQALLLIGVVCIAAACWLWGRKQLAQTGKVNSALALTLLVVALLLPSLTSDIRDTTAQMQSSQHWQRWSAEKLQQLKSEGKPVLVNMTADWCITCLVNERVALNTESSKAALALYDVTYLKGDWTLRDAAITEYLRLYQRDGVPLYVLYWPGQSPEVLPQILTPDTLATTLERLSRQP